MPVKKKRAKLESSLAEASKVRSTAAASPAARALALAVAGAGLDKKALGVEILDVTGKVDYAELLVLMSGRSDRHVHSIAKGVEEDVKKKLGVMPLSVEGLTTSSWVLIDLNDVVVHVFQENARSFYDLEGLWIDARRVPVPERLEPRSTGALD
ncbi:MAG: ribosome silencing factor [Myxococcales bacterium]|nr:ribosome silencing factor [Myxococcales bacterium]